MAYDDYEYYWTIDIDGNRVYKEVHRDLAEKKLGRKLLPSEVVHHIDGNKKNNNINNLMVFKTSSDHLRFHSSGVLIDMKDGTYTSPPVYYEFTCKNCGTVFKTQKKNAIFCSNSCYADYMRIDTIPSRDELLYKLKRESLIQIAKDYNVCTSTVKKWIKRYNIHFGNIKKIKPKKPKTQTKYVSYEKLPMTIYNKKNPDEKVKFKDIYALTEFFKKEYGTCDNDYTIRKNILRVIHGERKSFHGYGIVSKAYSREKKKALEERELCNIKKELNSIE